MSTSRTFSSRSEHRAWLADQGALPAGFSVGTAGFDFVPIEAPKPAKMTLTVIALERPTTDFAAVFTRNAFPGAPVLIGRKRLAEAELRAIVINNKVSNVCAPGGIEASERICAAAGKLLGCGPGAVLPCSTGVIGWTLPADAMVKALPDAIRQLKGGSVMPAAEGIVTTDLFPKVRRAAVGTGSVVGIAKGAGMIEPNLATMLVYLLTDVAVPRERLRTLLAEAVEDSFNCISVDSDTSTSDTVVVLSSGRVPMPAEGGEAVFAKALRQVCRELAEDVVRNGEGVRHVMRVTVRGCADRRAACALGKAIVNAPLFKCAVAGNDANVGRLVQAIGKFIGNLSAAAGVSPEVGSPASVPRKEENGTVLPFSTQAASQGGGIDGSRLRLQMGGIEIFSGGVFRLDRQKEAALTAHLKAAELYASAAPKDGVFSPAVDYPPHDRCVEIDVDLGGGDGAGVVTVFGGDLTHEYVSENADYRS